MNKPTRAADIQTPKVTVGPISASTKIYSSPEGHDNIRIPFREIALAETSGEAPFRVYDSSGPYTDASVAIDVEKGLPRLRDAWIKERGGIEAYDGRLVKPEDNGNVSGAHAARVFPTVHRPLRGTSPLPSTGRGRGWGGESQRILRERRQRAAQPTITRSVSLKATQITAMAGST
jgi:phosphomethylpyrimidine synthase